MTDNEIIKALECCTKIECKKCPVRHQCSSEGGGIDLGKVLDLINRQKAEIERLKDKVNKKGLVCQVKIDEERMKAIKNECLERIEYNIKEIKATAIKEFDERFKKKANMFTIARTNPTKPLGYEMDMEYRISKRDFDNLVKKMVGDAE